MKTITDKLKNWLLPLLFGSAVAYMIIYCYHRADAPSITLGFFLYALLLFFVFDVIRKIRYVSGLVYLALMVSVMILTLRPALRANFQGTAMGLEEWFYGAQTSTTVVPAYSVALIIGGGFFLISILYYFTQVIYRCFGTLLITIFPIAIYAKRDDTINTLYFAIVLCLYIALLIHNRQMKSDKGAVVIVNKSYTFSIVVFAVAVTLIISFMPKPNILSKQEQDSNYFDELGGTASTAFSSTSSGTGSELSDEIIMYVYADEPLYLRRQSYDYYDGVIWRLSSNDGRGRLFPDNYSEYYADLTNTSIINTFLSYVEKWKPYDFTYPESEQSPYQTKRVTIAPVEDYYLYTALSPLNTVAIYEIGTSNRIASHDKNYHGEFMPRAYNSNGNFRRGLTFEYVQTPANLSTVTERLSLDMTDMIFELSLMSRYYEEYEQIATNMYDDAVYSYQLFSGENDYYFSEMARIANEVTAPYDTEYEKARALESYFDNNGFTYDPRYIAFDSSPEYFVIESKTGTCGDYATAMTLMARYAGLTARYVEGFIAAEEGEDEDGNACYIIREKHAHAYVEVYIPGVGWMVFEPTVAGFLDYTYEQEMELNDYVLLVLRYLAVITAVVALVYALRRVITETVFRIRFAFAGSNKAAVLCYNRLVNHIAFKFKLNAKVLSPRQVLEILGGCGIDVNEIVDDFEKSLYGGKNLEAEDKKRILMVYKSAIKMLIRYKLTENKQNQTVTAPQP